MCIIPVAFFHKAMKHLASTNQISNVEHFLSQNTIWYCHAHKEKEVKHSQQNMQAKYDFKRDNIMLNENMSGIPKHSHTLAD